MERTWSLSSKVPCSQIRIWAGKRPCPALLVVSGPFLVASKHDDDFLDKNNRSINNQPILAEFSALTMLWDYVRKKHGLFLKGLAVLTALMLRQDYCHMCHAAMMSMTHLRVLQSLPPWLPCSDELQPRIISQINTFSFKLLSSHFYHSLKKKINKGPSAPQSLK